MQVKIRGFRLAGAIAFIVAFGAVAEAQQAPAAPQARFVVVLDAAHGGDDAGGHLANSQLEKALRWR